MITNINMPVMSGSLLLHVMQMCPKLADLPVVIASGQDKVVYSDKYKMLKKPYSIQDVIEIVKEYVPKVNGAVKHAI
jgi:FixJ family two-component response regulator